MSPRWPSVVLAASLVIYPATLHLVSKFFHGSARDRKYRDGISAIHCSIITAASLSVLIQRQFVFVSRDVHARKGHSASAGTNDQLNFTEDDINPMLAAKSVFANSITALETGYLLQDTVILLYNFWKGRQSSLRILLLHHVTLATALLWLQTRIWMGREKGVCIVVMFMLMNAS
jgi:TLC domain